MSDGAYICVRQRAGPFVKAFSTDRACFVRRSKDSKGLIRKRAGPAMCRTSVDKLELRLALFGYDGVFYTLAVDRDYKPQDGERETDFINIVAWRGTGEFVSKYFTKGRMAVVEGRLQVRDWTDKDGNKRRSTEVIADNVYFGDSKRSESGTPAEPSGEIRELPDEEKGELPFEL